MRFRRSSEWHRVETETGRLLGSVRLDDFGGVRVVTARTTEEPWAPDATAESRCFDASQPDPGEVPPDAAAWLRWRFLERRKRAQGGE